MLVRLAALSFACLMLLGIGVPAAQEVERIAAVVNDDMISIHDLEARLKMALVMSNIPDTLENRRRAIPQVLRKMMDERLQTQEATRIKVTITSEDIGRAIAGIERQNHMPPGGLLGGLAKAGVDTDAVRDQIRADLAWSKLTARVIAPTIKVSEEEIGDRLELLRQQIGRPEYLMAEIFLSVDTPTQEEEARRLGERLLEQLRAGAPFQALARQFSQTASAARGGVLGWVNEINIDDEIREAVTHMNKGDVSPLIRVGTGFNIVAVLDKRIAGTGLQNDETMTIVQAMFPYPTTGNVSREQMKAKATELTAPLSNCSEFEDFSRKLGQDRGARLDNGHKSDLPPEVRNAVEHLPVNKASAPTETNGGLLVFMVCSRSAIESNGLPSRDTLLHQIEDERVALQAQRYLRDLRRAAFVDVRL